MQNPLIGRGKSSGRSSFGSKGFSLTELLVVIAIMAIVIASVGPGLLTSQRDSHLTQAGNQLTDLAMLARQNALSHNAMTALVLINGPSSSPSSNRAAALLEMQSDQTWKQVSRWYVLPVGIKAYDDPNSSTSLPQIAGIPAPALIVSGQSVTAYTAFVFNPDGTMYEGTSSTRVASVQFDADPAPTSSGSATLRNYYDLVFNSDTGDIHVVRP